MKQGFFRLVIFLDYLVPLLQSLSPAGDIGNARRNIAKQKADSLLCSEMTNHPA